MKKYRRKKLYSSEQLDEAIDAIADMAAEQKVEVALIGGVAMQYYGSDRLTGDVDILSATELLALPGTPLTINGQVAGVQSVAPNGVPIDLLFADDLEAHDLYTEARENAEEMEGSEIPVVTPEYLAVLKMEAGRSKDEQDLHFLITEDLLNIPKTEDILKRHLGRYAVKEFRQTVELAKLEKKRQ